MSSDEEEAGSGEDQTPPQPPAYPSSGYASAANFQPGFGFGCPSKGWLKARGIIKPTFKGGTGFASGPADDLMEVEEEQKTPGIPQDKRTKLLHRFDHPEEYPGEAEDVQMQEAPEEKQPEVVHTDERVRSRWENRVPAAPIVRVAEVERPTYPRLAALYASQEGADLDLILDNSVHIRVHRVVLSIRSHYFSQMLTSNFAESAAKEVQLTGFSEAAVRALVQFFYEGRLETTGEYVLELLLLAEYCRVAGLKALIEEYLGRNVDEENVAALAAAAVDCKAWQLREYCVKFLLKNYSKTRLMKDVPKEVSQETKDRHQLLAVA